MKTMMKRDAVDTAALAHRSSALQFTRGEDEDDEHLYTFPLSSETPVRRWRGHEILVHDAKSVDLEFLNSGTAPLLLQHNNYSGQIGVIEKAWLSKKRLYVTVRFSNRAAAQEIRQDVDDGIMRNVSVGYDILTVEHTESEDDTPREYRVTSWKPMEASIVSIPADATVGVGRANQLNMENGEMPDTPKTGGMPAVTHPPAGVVAGNVLTDEARAAAREEQNLMMDEIVALGRSHNLGDVANDYIQAQVREEKPLSLAAFRGILKTEHLGEDTPLVNTDVGLNERQTQRFSVMKLAACMLPNATDSDLRAAQFEREACEQAARNFEGETRGYRVPEEVMRNWGNFEVDGVTSAQRAAMSTGANPNVQDVDHLASRFIDNLRNASSVMRAGITLLNGLSGDVEIPGGDTNSVAGWLAAEGDDAPETNPSFRKVTLAPKDIAGYTDITRRMTQQSTIDIEAYVRRQLVTAMALGIDKAALDGSGASGVPLGLKNTTGIGAVTFAALGDPTRNELIDMWSEVAINNTMMDNLAWIGNALIAAALMKKPVDPGSGLFLMSGPEAPVLATNFIMSNQVANNDLFYGAWSDMMLGGWGGLDLDRTTEGAVFLSGGVRMRAIQTVDTAVGRVGSFALGNGGS